MPFLKRNIRPGLNTTRIETFSDGVFAIAITILVLAIAVPELSSFQIQHGEMLKSLISLWPKFLSFFISFIIIGIFWIGHTIIFRFIKRADRVLLWLNTLLLLFICFIPFPAALIGQYGAEKYSLILYGLTIICVGIVFSVLWVYASRNFRLIDKTMDKRLVKKASIIIAAAPIVYVIAILIAFYNPVITLIIYILIPIAYIIPSPIDEFVDHAFDQENSS